nr:MAG TPA: hypothetical protein [Caudoviricetes sp.]
MFSELDSFEIEKAKKALQKEKIIAKVDLDGTFVNVALDPYLVEMYGEYYAIRYAVNHSNFVGAF